MMTHKVALLLLIAVSVANGGNFLGVRNEIDSAYINMTIQGALNGMLGSGHGVDDSRLESINATLVPIVNVLPKNERGRLSTPFFRYAVRRYFSQRHGWFIKGYEPQEDDTSEAADVPGARVMQNKIPGYVEAIVEKELSRGGFALQDVVSAIASIEALVFDETIHSLELAYSFNMLETTGPINLAPNLTHVLASYFLLEHLNGNRTSLRHHWAEKKTVKQWYPHWPTTFLFIKDIILEDRWLQGPFQSPFVAASSISFEDSVRMARIVSDRFGPFSNHECHDMKMKLAEMDIHGTGRVKLADFYRSSQGGAWQFLETSQYLMQIGALDKSSEHLGPQVIIPNYITGPNNCISSSIYYDVCCLNECDGIYEHLESRIKAPTASAAQVAQVIEEGIAMSPLLSSTAPLEPRNLSVQLRDMLGQVATHHHDMIPLHGRLFAQWLHFAFPQECPYPHMSGAVGRRQTVADTRKKGMPISATEEEMKQFIDSDTGGLAPSPEAGLDMWIMEEELLGSSPSASHVSSRLRTSVYALGLVSFSAVLLKEVLRLVRGRSPWHGKGTAKVLEYYV